MCTDSSSSSLGNVQVLVIVPLLNYPEIKASSCYFFSLIWQHISYCRMFSTYVYINTVYIQIYNPIHFFILSFSFIFNLLSVLFIFRIIEMATTCSFVSFSVIYVLVVCCTQRSLCWLCWCFCVYEIFTFIYRRKCLNLSTKIHNFLSSDLKIALFEKALEDTGFSEWLSILFIH